ncbi:hypothetical protein, partial [Pseudomonas sp. p50(2008)]|uniref:hypothetical protein n=1 Tax=Pseudomonas sp. p50(2008) TaxID=2816832 RepID=UPI001ABD29AA
MQFFFMISFLELNELPAAQFFTLTVDSSQCSERIYPTVAKRSWLQCVIDFDVCHIVSNNRVFRTPLVQIGSERNLVHVSDFVHPIRLSFYQSYIGEEVATAGQHYSAKIQTKNNNLGIPAQNNKYIPHLPV